MASLTCPPQLCPNNTNHPPNTILDPLYVVAVVSNPVRYKSRYRLYKAFEKHVLDSGAILITVEMAYGRRPFEITRSDNPYHVQVRGSHELWHKENLINIGISRLPLGWKYVAWVDADVVFGRPDWVQETLQQLQHYHVVQMWSHAQDLGPKYEPVGKVHKGFVYAYHNDDTFMLGRKKWGYYSSGHPGFAWAARKEALDATSGLIDCAIVGGGDRHMACGLIGEMQHSGPYYEADPTTLSSRFAKKLLIWQEHAAALNKNIGYVDGLLLHNWHGKKADRHYGDRWKIYIESGYDPDLDLKKDTQGLFQLTDRNYKFRDALRSYARSRNEDSLDVV